MKIFDLHCDTATALYHRNLPFETSETHLNAAALSGHEVTQCFAVFFRENGEDGGAFFEDVCRRVLPQLNRPGLTPLLTAEGVGVMAEEPGWEDLLQRRRCRMASLVWNGRNPLATGAVTDDKAPLTPRGRDAVRGLTERGIFVDISHLSAAGTEQALTLTEGPIIASHSNAKAVCSHPRNLSDTHAREIFRRGGLVGLNLYPPFLSEQGGTVTDLLRHAEHFLALGGEEGLALGCDLDGVECLPEGIGGFADLPRLFDALSHAFGRKIAHRIFYTNAARLFDGQS